MIAPAVRQPLRQIGGRSSGARALKPCDITIDKGIRKKKRN